LDKLILETDSPYLAPVPYRGKRNESAYLRYIADELSSIFMLGSHEIAEITTRNAKALFKI
jgi:TatD DNase family protein